MPSHTRMIRVAVAGGGIAGLCLAVGLLKYPHLEVHIYESTRKYLDVGAGLALHPNAIGAMQLIDPKLKDVYFAKALSMGEDPEKELATEIQAASGPNAGETVAFLGRAKGRKTVARADLLDGYASLIQPLDRLHHGKRMTEIKEQSDGIVQLRFSDGTTAEVDCLIAADGIHSVARPYIMGVDHPNAPAKDTTLRIYRRQVPMKEAKELVSDYWTNNVPIFIGHGGYLNAMPLKQGEILSISACCPAIFSAKGEDITVFNKDIYRDFIPEVRNMVELVSRDPGEAWAVYDHDPAPTYYNNHICMIGDAAHATSPAAGNGAAQAIEDAAVLTALFSKINDASQISKVFKAFDEVRRPRSQKVVVYSRTFAQHYNFSGDGVGDDIEKIRAYVREGGGYTAMVDLEAQNAAAVGLLEGFLKELD